MSLYKRLDKTRHSMILLEILVGFTLLAMVLTTSLGVFFYFSKTSERQLSQCEQELINDQLYLEVLTSPHLKKTLVAFSGDTSEKRESVSFKKPIPFTATIEQKQISPSAKNRIARIKITIKSDDGKVYSYPLLLHSQKKEDASEA